VPGHILQVGCGSVCCALLTLGIAITQPATAKLSNILVMASSLCVVSERPVEVFERASPSLRWIVEA